MKYIVIALSGAADQPIEQLDGKTPLEVAKVPNLHAFAHSGKVGLAHLAPRGFEPHPDTTLLNLLGYDADTFYTGRAPLEAANLELKLEDNEIPFRMNFVTEANGRLEDPEAGKITTKEAKALINFLNKKVASDFIRFFAGAQYRHIVVIKDSHGFEALSAKTHCPHDIVGNPIEDSLPSGPGGELLTKLMFDAKLLLQDHEINQVRIDLGENPANMIWVWGQGRKPKIDLFSKRFGCQGALISDAGYAKGFARYTGLTVVDSRAELSDLQANYEEKAKLLIDELKEKDFVCLHLKECDEASRIGDYRAKVSALESADFFILSKLRKYVEANRDVRVLISPCHVLPWRTRKRTRDDVPFVLAGKDVSSDEHDKCTELIAQASELKVPKPPELISFLLSK